MQENSSRWDFVSPGIREGRREARGSRDRGDSKHQQTLGTLQDDSICELAAICQAAHVEARRCILTSWWRPRALGRYASSIRCAHGNNLEDAQILKAGSPLVAVTARACR